MDIIGTILWWLLAIGMTVLFIGFIIEALMIGVAVVGGAIFFGAAMVAEFFKKIFGRDSVA